MKPMITVYPFRSLRLNRAALDAIGRPSHVCLPHSGDWSTVTIAPEDPATDTAWPITPHGTVRFRSGKWERGAYPATIDGATVTITPAPARKDGK